MYLKVHSDKWRNARHRAQWAVTLSSYIYPILGDLGVADVDVGHVQRALEPIWTRFPKPRGGRGAGSSWSWTMRRPLSFAAATILQAGAFCGTCLAERNRLHTIRRWLLPGTKLLLRTAKQGFGDLQGAGVRGPDGDPDGPSFRRAMGRDRSAGQSMDGAGGTHEVRPGTSHPALRQRPCNTEGPAAARCQRVPRPRPARQAAS